MCFPIFAFLKSTTMNNKNLAIVALILLAISTRLMPHLPNFTAVGAAALFGGAMFKSNIKAFAIPILALFFSDLIINNVVYASSVEGFQWFTKGFGYMYVGFALTVVIGKWGLKSFKALPVGIAVVVSTLVFFFLTNFGSWASGLLYPKSFAGLMEAYAAGLPFLLNQLASAALYSAVLFSTAYYVMGLRPNMTPVRA